MRPLIAIVALQGPESYRDAAQAAVKTANYRDDVVAWTLGETGQPQGPVLVREALSQNDISRGPGGGAGSIAVTAVGNAANVATNWLDFLRPRFRGRPHRAGERRDVAPKPAGNRRALERKARSLLFSMSGSAAQRRRARRVRAKRPGAVSPVRWQDGRPALCQVGPAAMPKGGSGSSVSVIARQDGTVLMLASGFGNDGDTGCSWMARLMFDTK